MAYTKPATAVDGTTLYDAARDTQMNNGIEAAAAAADAAQSTADGLTYADVGADAAGAAAAAQAAATLASSPRNAWTFRPEDYGATADVIFLNDVVTTAASATVVSASGGFANLTTGMSAVVACGSASGVTPQYVTLTKVSDTEATMSTPAVASVTCLVAYGSDSSADYNACVTAAVAYAQSNEGFAEILHSGFYGFASAPTLGGATEGNAYVPLPLISTTDRKVTLTFRGPGSAGALAHWQQLSPQAVGGGLVCLDGSGTVDVTYGPTALIGGPVNGYGSTSLFSNMMVVLDGISAVVPYNAPCAGFDFFGVAEVEVLDAGVFPLAIVPSGGSNPVPTQTTPTAFTNFGYFGLRMPITTNNAVQDVILFRCEGVVNGIRPSEHTRILSTHIINCYAGLVPYQGTGAMADRIHVISATIENCVHAIAAVDAAGATVRLDVDHLETETINSNLVADSDGLFQGYLRVAMYAQTISPSNVDTGAGFSIYDLKQGNGAQTAPSVPASTTALTNPFYRDAAVSVSGGTVTEIAVDGTATGLTAGTIIVPTGSAVTLTYSSAPSWTWVTL